MSHMLDDTVLRSRLKHPVKSSYVPRPVMQPPRTIVTDVALKRPGVIHKRPTVLPPTPPHPPLTPAISQAASNLADAPRRQVNPAPTLPRPANSSLLMRNIVSRPTRQERHTKHRSKLQLSLTALAIIMIITGAYTTLVGFRANHLVQVQADTLTKEANQAAVNPKTTATSSSAAAAPALSTVNITTSDLSNYVVAPKLPRYIIIPKLGVYARVLSVGVTSTGALGTPSNVYDTAWYNESAEPGQPGAMLIDGHVSSWTANGVFYGIKTLVAGDIIKVESGDSTIFTYQVVKSKVYSSGNVDMAAAMTPVDPGTPGLNLITCTGDVIPGTSEFNERIVVFATQIGS